MIPFDLTGHDAELAARTTAKEWTRIIAFRAHPDFMKALFIYHELIPRYFSNNLVLNKVVTEAWRFEMLVYALYLHDCRDPLDPRSGLTIANLQRICRRQKCASRGRVLAILGIMSIGGYLSRSIDPIDRRVIRLEPSEKFISIVDGWNRRIFEIIDAVQPADELVRSHDRDSRFSRHMRHRGAECLLEGWKLLDPFPEVFHFVSRDGGWMLLLTIVVESLRRGGGNSLAPVSIDLKHFGTRFAVSRSHLRRLLEAAYEQRLLAAPPQNGTFILPSTQLVASFLTCMASELGNYRLWALEARKAIRT